VALSVTDSDDEDADGNRRACTSRFGAMGLDKSDHEGSGIGALRLVGCERFVRTNPKSDRFAVQRFHHIEFWYQSPAPRIFSIRVPEDAHLL
jgi:hypothetical protein